MTTDIQRYKPELPGEFEGARYDPHHNCFIYTMRLGDKLVDFSSRKTGRYHLLTHTIRDAPKYR